MELLPMRNLKPGRLSGLLTMLFLSSIIFVPGAAFAQPDYEGGIVDVPESAVPFNYHNTASYHYSPSDGKRRASIKPPSPTVQSRSLKRPPGSAGTDPTYGALGPAAKLGTEGPALLRLLAREPATGSTRETSPMASSAPESANPFFSRSGHSPGNSRIYDASARVRVSAGVSAVPR